MGRQGDLSAAETGWTRLEREMDALEHALAAATRQDDDRAA